MTPHRLAECITLLGWTQRGLARMLNRADGTIGRWLTGSLPIPADAARWIEGFARYAEKHPPPTRDRRERSR